MTSCQRQVTLRGGQPMPLLGLGMGGNRAGVVHGELAKQSVRVAIQAGYRLFDTASAYDNEADIGEAIREVTQESGEKGVTRGDLFLVTKLRPEGMRPSYVEKHMRASLQRLQTDYVDLYLIHTPVGFREDAGGRKPTQARDADGNLMIDPSTDLIAIWHEMERMVELGLARAIGLSNCNLRQVTKIIANAVIPPAVLQVECHVHFQQPTVLQFCREHDIALMGYAPLGSPRGPAPPGAAASARQAPDLLNDPVVCLVAEKHHRTPAQILLRFQVQRGVAVIPKSKNPQRIADNAAIFDFKLEDLDMRALAGLDGGEAARSFKFANKPGYGEHPEVPY